MTTYIIRGFISDHRPTAETFASFNSKDDAIAYIQDTYEVLGLDIEDDEYTACVRPKGRPCFAPYIIDVVAR